jgi:hypothetical protein
MIKLNFMQKNWTFEFPSSEKQEENLGLLLSKKRIELEIFLSYYYKNEGAVADKVILVETPEFSTETSGSFTLQFDLVHFNACLAIHEEAKEEMKINFEIDVHHKKLLLKGPDWPTREMDEI